MALSSVSFALFFIMGEKLNGLQAREKKIAAASYHGEIRQACQFFFHRIAGNAKFIRLEALVIVMVANYRICIMLQPTKLGKVHPVVLDKFKLSSNIRDQTNKMKPPFFVV